MITSGELLTISKAAKTPKEISLGKEVSTREIPGRPITSMWGRPTCILGVWGSPPEGRDTQEHLRFNVLILMF